jgi:very-short-patch-repair endonuclease
MKKYLSGRKALEYWGIIEACETLHLPKTEEYVFFSEREYYRPSGVHWCRIAAAERYTKHGVCTLPYLFLRYANELSLLQLIYLGLQVCACPSGRNPQCTVLELKECAYSLKGHHGRRNSLRAIQYIQDRSRSPMESKLYMHLCLPNHLGGCGFPKAILNHPVKVDSQQFFLDLYFPEARLGVEYDSYEHHSNTRSFSLDTIRASKLLTAGYRIVHVKPGQLSNIDAYQDLIMNLSDLLQKPIYIRTDKFFEPFKELHHFFKPSGYSPVLLSDVPQFSGVPKAYDRYIQARRRD